MPDSSAPETRRAVGSVEVSIWLALAALGGVAAFWTGFDALADAWGRLEYSHGPLIPFLALFLFARQLRRTALTDIRTASRWPGLLVTLFGLLVASIGTLAQIPDVVTYGMILWVFGLVLVGLGFRQGWRFWPPVLFLVFMLPVPSFMYWTLSTKLQLLSSGIGVALIQLMGIPVFLDGNIIDLGVYKLQVAEACSGLRYLVPFLSFSFFVAALLHVPVWQRIIIFLSAAPIAIIMNSVRIGITGVLVDRYGIDQAEGFMHYFEGWILFLACVLILLAIARVMQWMARDRRPFYEVLDLNLAGVGSEFRRGLTARPPVALIVAAVATVIVGGVWQLAPSRPVVEVSRVPLVLFPRSLGSWTAGPQQRLDPTTAAVLKADDYYSATYLDPTGRHSVNLFIAYYLSQIKDAGIHSPEVCIPGDGWEMSAISRVVIPVRSPGGGVANVPVNRAVIRKGLVRQLVYYWFEQRGRRFSSDYVVKAATVYDSVVRGRTDGAIVRLITPIKDDEPEASADARLRDFLAQSLGPLPRYVPN